MERHKVAINGIVNVSGRKPTWRSRSGGVDGLRDHFRKGKNANKNQPRVGARAAASETTEDMMIKMYQMSGINEPTETNKDVQIPFSICSTRTGMGELNTV